MPRSKKWAGCIWLPLLLLSAVNPADANNVEGTKAVITTTGSANVATSGLIWRWAASAASLARTNGAASEDVVEEKLGIFRGLGSSPQQGDSTSISKKKSKKKNAGVGPTATPVRGAAMAAVLGPAQTAPPLPPPVAELRRRQADTGQIQALSAQIQSLSLVASSISQASRQVSQTSQQLAQQVTQLSQSTDQLSRSVQALQLTAQQAQQSAQQASQSAQQASQSAQQASQSASSAISSAQQSAASSASAAISSSLAILSSSASSIIAAASASALGISKAASSQVQAAQADATLARTDAETQVQKAQGAAVSVTQAALAVVGTFVGSSLLTVAAFYVVLRYKGNRQRLRRETVNETSYLRRPGDGLPRGWDNGGGSFAVPPGENAYPRDTKEPLPLSVAAAAVTTGGQGSFSEKRLQRQNLRGAEAGEGKGDLSRPLPRPRSRAQSPNGEREDYYASVAKAVNSESGRLPADSSGANSGNYLDRRPRTGGSFSLFPTRPTTESPRGIGMAISNGPALRENTGGASRYESELVATTATAVDNSRGSTGSYFNPTKPPASLQQWLLQGTVSPFGTLRRDQP